MILSIKTTQFTEKLAKFLLISELSLIMTEKSLIYL